MSWKYNEAGRTYNDINLQYNLIKAIVVTVKNYYTGASANVKRMLRGWGF